MTEASDPTNRKRPNVLITGTPGTVGHATLVAGILHVVCPQLMLNRNDSRLLQCRGKPHWLPL